MLHGYLHQVTICCSVSLDERNKNKGKIVRVATADVDQWETNHVAGFMLFAPSAVPQKK
jgi:hypothetical protein